MVVLVKNAAAPAIKAVGQQVRGMATEKQILMRIGATSNIAKITKSMKMVSAAKMRGAENRMIAGRPFIAWLDNVTSGKNRIIERDGVVPTDELDSQPNVFVVISSDRGLCGGINSFAAKAVRKQFANVADRANTQLFVIGEKGRAQLRREFSDIIRGNATEAYVNAPTFTVASAIAEAIISSGVDSEKVHVFYNKFVSAIAYSPSIRSLGVSASSEDFDQYELEPEEKNELLADLKEYEIASAIFHGIIENSTSEESSRMTAMENATNNAQDLIQSLTLKYNKARQTRITTELIEIISGAASLDAQK